MNKGISTKKLILAGAVLAGVSFIAGRKEGFKLGLDASRVIHRLEGCTQAMVDEVRKNG